MNIDAIINSKITLMESTSVGILVMVDICNSGKINFSNDFVYKFNQSVKYFFFKKYLGTIRNETKSYCW